MWGCMAHSRWFSSSRAMMRWLVRPPRSMNFMATCSSVSVSSASCTKPEAPLQEQNWGALGGMMKLCREACRWYVCAGPLLLLIQDPHLQSFTSTRSKGECLHAHRHPADCGVVLTAATRDEQGAVPNRQSDTFVVSSRSDHMVSIRHLLRCRNFT